MKYKAIFFDVDGTLFDTSEGIYDTFKYVFKRFGIDAESSDPSFIGPPISTTLERFFEGVTLDEARIAFREHYDKNGKFCAKLYDGIECVLAILKADGKRIYTATSKSEAISEELARKFGIHRYFDRILGADYAAGRVEKDEVLRYALNVSGEKPTDCLLIGDTRFDVQGAETVGIDCLCAAYGFGKRSELKGNRVVGIVDSASDIIKFLRGL
ncbi:MAG: HAD hydrolase-like protein [Clostridiales bacterium]|jgi:phosphoglycolate phosphatase|nr:HAD hydrolase-like protein [Clostridiales bacterium]